MPNKICIIHNGAVGREHACSRNVHKRHLDKFLSVGVSLGNLLLCSLIIGKIGKCHIRVGIKKRVVNLIKFFTVYAVLDKLHSLCKSFVIMNISLRIIALVLELINLGRFHAEDINIILSHSVENLHICTVESSESNCAVEHKFHITCTRSLGSRK